MTAPFPYFGGKSRIAAAVWERFGNVPNYIEPFFGSGAVLLARPSEHRPAERIETVNDADCLLVNFWRSVQADPDAVAYHADWPVSECDLHARHSWLVQRGKGLVAERLMGDPDFYDAKIAGWWVWGACCWIGGGWCSGNGAWVSVDGVLTKADAAGDSRRIPHLSSAGQGVTRQLPHVGGPGRGDTAPSGVKRQMPLLRDGCGSGVTATGIHRKVPHLGGAGRGVAAPSAEPIREWMRALSDRLRRVRIVCGDWSRITGPAVTTHCGLTGVFLDPPYSLDERHQECYAVEGDVAAAVREWAIANGDNPELRIALCGYEGEHAIPDTWECVAWKAAGGYGSQGNGRGRENAARERIWFSPACLGAKQPTLF